MNETELAEGIASGALKSPQMCGGFQLWSLRITGTGLAYRAGHEEHVWRDPSLYCNEEFLQRCYGLPIIVNHPNGEVLDGAEYASRNVGTVVLPYIARLDGIQAPDGDQVWAVGRIYNDAVNEAMANEPMSTSPAVVFGRIDPGQTLATPDGKTMLIEGEPLIVDHLALCPAGVWDVGQPPNGIRNDSTKEPPMTTETTSTGDNVTNPDGSNMDKYLERFDAMMTKRMDEAVGKLVAPIMQRMDALESKRPDSERDTWMAEDAAQCARDDAAEAEEAAAHEKDGDPKEVAADKARKARKDRMAGRRDAQARHDAAPQWRGKDDKSYAEMADTQARVDSFFQAWGQRAPMPMAGEEPLMFRARLARHHQQHCTEPTFKDLDLRELVRIQPALLSAVEDRIYADSAAASKSPTFGDETLRARRHTNESGHQITTWHGRTTIFKQFAQPSMRVTKFNTPQNVRP